ncbi:MAG: hypothetical protein U9Q06_04170 [Nanoarchaeota archaeon]|nr:hypothetical protein [Nanoarchaeota archaeon]
MIVSNNELALNESENWETLRELYFNWINGLKTNLVDITGEVIGMQWISDEV